MDTSSHPGLGRFLILTAALMVFTTVTFSQTKSSRPKSAPASVASDARFDQLAQQAERARESGDSPKAIRLYEEAVRQRPSWAEGWWYLGMLYYDGNQYGKAAPALQHVVGLKPEIGSAWTFLGLCEFEIAKYPEALQHLEIARRQGFGDLATSRVASYHMAMLLTLNQRFDEATSLLVSQFGQEKLSAPVAVVMGLALLRMPILPADLDVSRKELVFNAGQASAELAHQRHAAALQLLQSIEADHPEVPCIHLATGRVLLQLSRLDEAATEAEEELKLSSNGAETYRLLAEIRLKQGRHADALAAAKRAEAVEPKNAETHYLISASLRAAGDAEGAKQEFDLAKNLGWRVESPEDTGPTNRAMPMPVTGSGAEPDARFEDLRAQSSAARQAGRIDEAMQAYREALAIRPDWAEGILYLATFHYGAQQYGEALKLARRLSAVQPNVGATWALLGLCEFHSGEYENALVHLKRGQDIGFPEGSGGAISEANYHIGILQNWKGDFGPAHDLLLQEAKGGPRAEDARFALGINLLRLRQLPSQVRESDRPMVEAASAIAMDLSRSDYGPATSKFDELLQKFPNRGYVHDAYGWTLMSISRYDAAAAQYREEIRISPDSAEAYLGVATAALKTHKYDEARDAAKKAVELSPESAMAHGQYGRALIELGDLRSGTSELEKAVQLAIQVPELHYSLSRAYMKSNRQRDAERERQIFLRLNQQNKRD